LEHPLLEQAAFDFATGHVLSAETALGLALRDEQSPEMACHLHQALLDLYWATQRHAELQAQSQAFRQRHGLAPVTRPELEPAKLDAHRTASFAANGAVDRLQVRVLQRALADPAGHLVLDFSGLTGVAEDAREPLATVLIELKARQGDLELHGLDVLQAHIRLHNEPATATATAADATLRQLALRLSSDANALMVPARPSPASTPKQPRSARLGGEFTGGDDAFLQPLRTLSAHADSIVVDLQGLRRMDFTAATGLLNWVDAQQRLDKLVLLRGAHGLLAPLLQLVGLQLHA
jgi:ABC-type transporter Mla MlaB component